MKMTREQYYDIRNRKDENYENMFFIGSWTRGVFCNVTCPDYPPEDKNDLVYFRNIYEALEVGLIPCKDCEPDMHSDQIRLNIELSNEVNNAVNLIDEGYLNVNTVSGLAKELFISERHLRRLFQQEVGISPTKLALYQRVFFAKKLIYDTDMKMADIAFASGFNSVRDFNYVFKQVFHVTPSDTRKERTMNLCGTEDEMMIPYYDGFNFAAALKIIEKNLIPEIEEIKDGVYYRSFSISGINGQCSVKDIPEIGQLQLSLTTEDKRCIMGVYHRIQRMLGLMDKLTDNILGFDPYEVAIREILSDAKQPAPIGEILSELIRLTNENTEEHNSASEQGETAEWGTQHKHYVYPDRQSFTDEIVDKLPISGETGKLIKGFNEALKNNEITLAYNQSYDRFIEGMSAIEGISDALAEKIASKGLNLYKESV